MRRNPWTWMLVAIILLSLIGCSASPQPMTVLMPTFSFSRDIIEPVEETTPAEADVIAAADP